MKYFTLKELTRSSTAAKRGLDNTPGPEELKNLEALVDNVLDPLRQMYAKPIIVNSAFRSKEVNKAVGGVPTSQHTKGQAADIRSVSNSRGENKKLFDLIKNNLPYDQLINEYDYSWIHVSYKRDGSNRRQIVKIV